MLHDRIEKSAVLHASLERVWRAVGDSAQFGTWFGMDIDQPFVEGATVMAVMTATAVDEEIAAQQKPHAGANCPLRSSRLTRRNAWLSAGIRCRIPNSPM